MLTFDIDGPIISDIKSYLMKTGINELKNSIFITFLKGMGKQKEF